LQEMHASYDDLIFLDFVLMEGCC